MHMRGLWGGNQSAEVSRLRGFYYRLHPLMFSERGAEITSGFSVNRYCDRWIVFGRQDAVGGQPAILRRLMVFAWQDAAGGHEARTNFCTNDRVKQVKTGYSKVRKCPVSLVLSTLPYPLRIAV